MLFRSYARVIQFLVPLYLVTVVLNFASVKQSRPSRIIFGFLALLSISHFFVSENCSFIPEWKEDADNIRVMDDLTALHEKDPTAISLGIRWTLEPGLNYERERRNANWLTKLTRDGIDSTYDYYYVPFSDTASLKEKGAKTLHCYPLTEHSLLKY